MEVIAKNSQDKKWEVSIDKKKYAHERIRRMSLDKFYGIVFGDEDAFMKMCKALPTVLDDVLAYNIKEKDESTVFQELGALSPDVLRSLYLLAFNTYDGFERF